MAAVVNDADDITVTADGNLTVVTAKGAAAEPEPGPDSPLTPTTKARKEARRSLFNKKKGSKKGGNRDSAYAADATVLMTGVLQKRSTGMVRSHDTGAFFLRGRVKRLTLIARNIS